MTIEFSNIKKRSNILYQIKTIYGISLSTAKRICNTIGIGNTYQYDNLTPIQKYYLKLYVNNLTVDVDLKHQIEKNINYYKLNNSYRGLRHRLGYPVRGQRTRSNAKTVKKLKTIK